MNWIARLFCATLLLCATGLDRLPAQEPDAYVLRPGVLRLQAGGAYTHVRGLQVDGAVVAPGSGLAGPLHAGAFLPLRALEEQLRDFYGATPPATAPVIGPETLQLGTLDFAMAANRRSVPVALELGVLPRLQLGARLPMLQEERLVQRLGLSGGTVARNPDPAGNAARLGAVDPRWRALGGAPLLPTSASALGRALQDRVRALTGDTLQLPTEAAGVALFQELLRPELGVAPLASGLLPWTVGDVEVEARLGLFGTFRAAPYPVEPEGVEARGALTVGLRLPTGRQADTLAVPLLFEDVGLSALHARLDTDLFLGPRVWTTLRAGYTAFRPVAAERRLVDRDAPLAGGRPEPVQWRPGDRLELRILPRFRLTEEISLGAEYSLFRVAAPAHTAENPAVERLARPGGATHRIAVGGRYTTLPARHLGAQLLPMEVGLRYGRTLAVAEGELATSWMEAQLSVFPRLFGR